MRQLAATVFFLILACTWGSPVPGLVPVARGDEELDKHLDDLRRKIEDPKINVVHRAQQALEMAATLDRVGQSSMTMEERRARWTEAIRVLDDFNRQNPGHPRAREFDIQAAVYLWARARSSQNLVEQDPTHRPSREESIKDFDATLLRLRAVRGTLTAPTALPVEHELLDQNIRFRLAQTLADRAELDPEESETRRRREDEALKALERPITEPTLRGFAHLLRAELLDRNGRFDQAIEAVDAAAKSKPAPPAADVLSVRVGILAGQKRFDDAIKIIESSSLDTAAKDALAVHVLLTRRANQASGNERSAAESAMFRRVANLRGSKAPETRPALIELARRLIEPDGHQDPDAWEAVAEGALALGDLVRASRLEKGAAARADALGHPEQAATLRLRAGAYLYQAERYREADAVLTQVVDNPGAGESRPGAGMLRALARGRALAQGQPGASQKAYVDALESQIRDFPRDPSTQEALWLLGRLRLASSDRDAALALWSAIEPASTRWLDAQTEVARLNQDDLDNLRIGNDRKRVDARYQEARAFLTQGIERARDAIDKAELGLALARLELTPIVGHPDEARARLEQIQHAASRPDQRDRARRLHLVALAELNRFLEAEQEARTESTRSQPSDLLPTARLLDHITSELESDMRMRRFGSIIRTLLANASERAEGVTEAGGAELRLRLCRALLFRGDDAGARRTLTAWNGHPHGDDDRFLKDLADTYFRLGAYVMAIDVERHRLKRLTTGSLPWFEARYRLALAEYREGKPKDALHLVEATAILHPDLGGGDLRDKFHRLRQRIAPNP